MSVEVTIVCDMCSAIVVAANTAGLARREGKRDKTLFRVGLKDLCAGCYPRYKAAIERVGTQRSSVHYEDSH